MAGMAGEAGEILGILRRSLQSAFLANISYGSCQPSEFAVPSELHASLPSVCNEFTSFKFGPSRTELVCEPLWVYTDFSPTSHARTAFAAFTETKL